MTSLDLARRTVRGMALSAAIALAPLLVPAAAASSTASPDADNAVVTWDINAQTAIFEVAAQPQTAQVRSFAMVNGAVYDAVNAIAGTRYQPYLVAPPATGTESADAAVATAAYRVLVGLFPAQQDRLQAQYDQSLATIPDGPAEQGGIAVGGQAAAAMLAARHNDGVFGSQSWVVGTRPGEWRPTPPTFDSQGAWLGYLKPFIVPDATMFRTAGPPALTSRAYAHDVNEVQRVGAQSSTVRTRDQTEAASWWHDRRSTGWEIKRQLVKTQRLNLLQTARLFALADLSVADAAIACYNEKAAWNFWRPITAIQLADTDGNPATTADPTWTPLLVTPPFPEYTSGHACATGARMSAFASFFGRNNISFSAFSVDTGTTRHFTSFSQAIAEAIDARVWAGIHFRTADTEGAKIGIRTTGFITSHYFRRQR